MASATSDSERDSRALLDLAKSSPHDFYALLDLHPTNPTSTTEGSTLADAAAPFASITHEQIAKAHRKAAAKNHPDNPRNRDRKDAATEEFHKVKEAWAVLGDVLARQAYDERRLAEWAKKEREGLLEGRRRAAFDDLRRREDEAALSPAGVKRKRGEGGATAGANGMDEVAKIAAMGARKRMEMEERRRREREEEAERLKKQEEADENPLDNSHETTQSNAAEPGIPPAGVSEIDRTIKVRWLRSGPGASLDTSKLHTLFTRFGAVDNIFLLRDKKARPSLAPSSPAASPGDKKVKKQLMGTACIVFVSIVGAHAAVLDAPKLHENAADDNDLWSIIDSVSWAASESKPGVSDSTTNGNKESTASPPPTTPPPTAPKFPFSTSSSTTLNRNGDSKRASPAFSSFATASPMHPASAASHGPGSGASFEERTLMKLKEAERRREEERIRRAEEMEIEAETQVQAQNQPQAA